MDFLVGVMRYPFSVKTFDTCVLRGPIRRAYAYVALRPTYISPIHTYMYTDPQTQGLFLGRPLTLLTPCVLSVHTVPCRSLFSAYYVTATGRVVWDELPLGEMDGLLQQYQFALLQPGNYMHRNP
jgi:hypothetical protein